MFNGLSKHSPFGMNPGHAAGVHQGDYFRQKKEELLPGEKITSNHSKNIINPEIVQETAHLHPYNSHMKQPQHQTVDKVTNKAFNQTQFFDDENYVHNTTGNKDRKRRKIVKTLVLSGNKLIVST